MSFWFRRPLKAYEPRGRIRVSGKGAPVVEGIRERSITYAPVVCGIGDGGRFKKGGLCRHGKEEESEKESSKEEGDQEEGKEENSEEESQEENREAEKGKEENSEEENREAEKGQEESQEEKEVGSGQGRSVMLTRCCPVKVRVP